MGGGGGGSYFPSKPRRFHDLIKQTKEAAEQNRLNSEVNDYLQLVLAKFNERNAEKVQEYLEKIEKALEKDAVIDRFLFGGSVAKHTFVDGLSDVDALVVLDRADIKGKTPDEVLDVFCNSLKDRLTQDEVASVEKGSLAVTVTYNDETEIQLLPAVRVGRSVAIASSGGQDWKQISPRAFQTRLTRANQNLNGVLVPTIKLVKSMISSVPEDLKLTGYHVEALGLDATKGYRGERTVKALLVHVLSAASKRVMSPISDLTSQSRTVDEYLGKANSSKRQSISNMLAGLARRLDAATSVDRWKEITEE
jgi:predicted nucleotidyltransferase